MLLSTQNPESGMVPLTYTYNTDGTIATKTDAKGQQIQYAYDPYQRLIKVSRSDGSVDNYTYDVYPNSQNAQGRLAAVSFAGVTDPNTQAPTQFTYQYSYNPPGQVTAKKLAMTRGPYPGVGGYAYLNFEADYAYDNEGHMTSLTYPTVNAGCGALFSGAMSYTYGYDTMGRQNTLTYNQPGSRPHPW